MRGAILGREGPATCGMFAECPLQFILIERTFFSNRKPAAKCNFVSIADAGRASGMDTGDKMRVAVALIFLASTVVGASQQTRGTGAGIITGRVTLGERPMPHVTVTVLPKRGAGQQTGAALTSVTDEDGRFRIDQVPAGSYVINAFAPGLVGPSEGFSVFEPGKIVTLVDNESVLGIDISLKRGAVITGRILDVNRQPLVDKNVRLVRVDENGRTQPSHISNPAMYRTDDRGVYRLYGLPPGRYKVSVGEGGEPGIFTFPTGSYLRTFYPDVTEESKAAIIELGEGVEVTNVDIRVSSFLNPYTVSGRIINAGTGAPMAGARYGYAAVGDDGRYVGSVSVKSTPASPRGEFSIEGLLPGRYAFFVVNEGKAEAYSEPTVVELKDADVSGVEIKAHRGGSISGTVLFEDVNVSDISAKLADLVITINVQSQTLQSLRTDSPPVKPDGSFYVGGVLPGAAQLSVHSVQGDRNISLLRIELNGVEQQIIDLKDGENLTGVRLVLGYGTGTIRGEVVVQTGSVPEGLVVVGHTEGVTRSWRAEVDARGHFVLEGMPTGEYELTLAGPSLKPMKRRVSVTTGVEAQVTFTLDPG
jgi:hypothetical protein